LSGTIGFIGLGAMGLPVARRLAGAGHRLLVFDAAPDRLAAASAEGIGAATSVAEVVERADLLFVCVASPGAGESILSPLRKAGLVVCDLSTIGPTLARRLHAELAARGIGYVECPMLGGVDEAASGQLFLLVSGDPEATAKVSGLLPTFSRVVRVVGGPGSASLFKTLQNGLGLAQLCAMAEALAVVERAGGDAAAFVEVVGEGGGMAATPLFRAKAPLMLRAPPLAKGSLHIGAKDSRLAASLAREVGIDARLLEASAALFAKAMASGLAAEDIAAVRRVIGSADA
jgi:3-hydroxyisobutyrate dehydrogenase-like beta-hydroxyacid dehydrogenase